MSIAIIVGAYDESLAIKNLIQEGIESIYAFEPHPMNFKDLQKSLAEFEDKVVLIEAACWNEDCELPLYEGTSPVGHTLHVEKKEVNADIYTLVQCIDLAKFIQELGRVYLLQLDCEGAEYEIIPHLFATGTMDLVKRLDVEFHYRKLTAFDLQTQKDLEKQLKDWVDKDHTLKTWYA
jgi:FkbM family methyltransferase